MKIPLDTEKKRVLLQALRDGFIDSTAMAEWGLEIPNDIDIEESRWIANASLERL